jgi:hypothetical protein
MPFLDINRVLPFLFTPEYYLCYLGIALLWAVSFCFTYNRTVMQGCLAAALVVLVLALSYLASHLSIAPASDIISFTILFFVSLFSAVVSIYYLANRNERTSVILPLVFLLLSSSLMWLYMVSGAAQTIRKTTKALISNIHPKQLRQFVSNKDIEQELGINSKRDLFAKIDKQTDISNMDQAASYEFFNNLLRRIGGGKFTEENSPLFIHLLNDYYHGGESKMNYSLWSHALTIPLENFNRKARENSAYTFMMILLMLLSVSFCVGSLLKIEEE